MEAAVNTKTGTVYVTNTVIPGRVSVVTPCRT
jgi:hypothetical protein